MTGHFLLAGQEFVALHGGPAFTFSPAISFIANYETQQELDIYQEKFSVSAKAMQCGWLKGRFGVSWQIVPTVLPELLNSADHSAAQRASPA